MIVCDQNLISLPGCEGSIGLDKLTITPPGMVRSAPLVREEEKTSTFSQERRFVDLQQSSFKDLKLFLKVNSSAASVPKLSSVIIIYIMHVQTRKHKDENQIEKILCSDRADSGLTHITFFSIVMLKHLKYNRGCNQRGPTYSFL